MKRTSFVLFLIFFYGETKSGHDETKILENVFFISMKPDCYSLSFNST